MVLESLTLWPASKQQRGEGTAVYGVGVTDTVAGKQTAERGGNSCVWCWSHRHCGRQANTFWLSHAIGKLLKIRYDVIEDSPHGEGMRTIT